ncbi:hypothetical protein BDV93DRAFT_161110 [Ceratobasidium sp. AG-I]|nr:hypothetical protein BDV93DRAFT_161110 [Ceratobasidium sp. AG-I]
MCFGVLDGVTGQLAGQVVGLLVYRTAGTLFYRRELIAECVLFYPDEMNPRTYSYAFVVLSAGSLWLSWLHEPASRYYLSYLNRQHAATRRGTGKRAVVIDKWLEESKVAHRAMERSGGGRRRRRGNDERMTRRSMISQIFIRKGVSMCCNKCFDWNLYVTFDSRLFIGWR